MMILICHNTILLSVRLQRLTKERANWGLKLNIEKGSGKWKRERLQDGMWLVHFGVVSLAFLPWGIYIPQCSRSGVWPAWLSAGGTRKSGRPRWKFLGACSGWLATSTARPSSESRKSLTRCSVTLRARWFGIGRTGSAFAPTRLSLLCSCGHSQVRCDSYCGFGVTLWTWRGWSGQWRLPSICQPTWRRLLMVDTWSWRHQRATPPPG